MGKLDKDRHQKELALRYCLATNRLPFLEVVVPSSSDLSDVVESLTDLDVLGVESAGDGVLRRTIFDCKSANKMSAINRAFWASGVMSYTMCDEAFVILKNRAVHNHRISALILNVDLHDEISFVDLGRTVDPAFPADACYQASIERWNRLQDCYDRNPWSKDLFEISRNAAPLTKKPWSVFRKLIAELRTNYGRFDPKKEEHIAIFLDVLSSTFVLWVVMARDIRRFFEPNMEKKQFEEILRYYFWGGKESYDIRLQLRDRKSAEVSEPIGLPEWTSLIAFAGLVISAPQHVFDCAYACRELAIRTASEVDAFYENSLSSRLQTNPRIRQYSIGLGEYLIGAGKLPKELMEILKTTFFER